MPVLLDRKSTRLNSSHGYISYAVFCLKKKKKTTAEYNTRAPRPTPIAAALQDRRHASCLSESRRCYSWESGLLWCHFFFFFFLKMRPPPKSPLFPPPAPLRS